jgi:hypothetical protein
VGAGAVASCCARTEAAKTAAVFCCTRVAVEGNGDGSDPGVRWVCRRGWRLSLSAGLVSVTMVAELLGREFSETISRQLLGYIAWMAFSTEASAA